MSYYIRISLLSLLVIFLDKSGLNALEPEMNMNGEIKSKASRSPLGKAKNKKKSVKKKPRKKKVKSKAKKISKNRLKKSFKNKKKTRTIKRGVQKKHKTRESQAQLKNIIFERDYFKNENEQAFKKQELLSQEIQRKEQSLQELTHQFRKLNGEVDFIQEIFLKGKMEEANHWQRTLQEDQNKLREKQDYLQFLEERYRELQSQGDDEETRQHLYRIEEEISETEACIKAAQQEIGHLNERYQEYTQDCVKGLYNRFLEVYDQVQATEEEKRRAEEQKEISNQHLNEARQQIEDLTHHVAEQTHNLERTQENLEMSSQEIARLQETIVRLREDNTRRIEEERQNLAQVQQQLQEVAENRDALQHDLRETRRALEDLERMRLSDLERLTDDIREKEEKINEMHTQIIEKDLSLRRMATDKDASRRLLRQQDQEARELHIRIADLERQVMSLTRERDYFKQEMQNLQQRIQGFPSLMTGLPFLRTQVIQEEPTLGDQDERQADSSRIIQNLDPIELAQEVEVN